MMSEDASALDKQAVRARLLATSEELEEAVDNQDVINAIRAALELVVGVRALFSEALIKECAPSAASISETLSPTSIASASYREALRSALKDFRVAMIATDTKQAVSALMRAGLPGLVPPAYDEELRYLERRIATASSGERIHLLCRMAKLALLLGDFANAQRYASEALTPNENVDLYRCSGEVFHDANVILGVVSLRCGDIETAKQCLLLAGRTTGSAVLSTFGPNMILARELLLNGQAVIVLEYLELCKRFWRMDRGRIQAWIMAIRRGEIPDFGPSLNV
jgi:hypothetical protein